MRSYVVCPVAACIRIEFVEWHSLKRPRCGPVSIIILEQLYWGPRFILSFLAFIFKHRTETLFRPTTASKTPPTLFMWLFTAFVVATLVAAMLTGGLISTFVTALLLMIWASGC